MPTTPYSSQKKLSKKKKWAYSLVATLLVLTVIESVAWWLERREYMGGFSLQSSAHETLYIDKGDDRPHLRPGAKLSGARYSIAINKYGFRGPELERRKANTVRIWFIGGSTTFDIYASSNETTWPALTGAGLQAAWPDKKIEVINAGIPGETIRGNRQDFQNYYGQIHPDILVIHAGPNDLRSSSIHAPGLASEPLPGPFHRLATYRLLSRKLQLQRIPQSWKNREIDHPLWERLETDIRHFIAAAQQKGVKVVLATHAHRAKNKSRGRSAAIQVAEGTRLLRMDAVSVIKTFEQYNEMIRRIAKEQGIPLIDLREQIPARVTYFGDHTHFSSKGSRLAAKSAVEVLKKLELQP